MPLKATKQLQENYSNHYLIGTSRKLDLDTITLTDIQKQDKNGNNLMHWAASYKRDDLLEAFIKKGADVNCLNNNNRTPLYLAAEDKKGGATVKFLLAHGAKTDLYDKQGATPVHHAVTSQSEDAVLAFINHNKGALETLTQNGFTAIALAVTQECKAMIPFLVKSGAKTDVPIEDKSLVEYAKEHFQGSTRDGIIQALKGAKEPEVIEKPPEKEEEVEEDEEADEGVVKEITDAKGFKLCIVKVQADGKEVVINQKTLPPSAWQLYFSSADLPDDMDGATIITDHFGENKFNFYTGIDPVGLTTPIDEA